MIPDRPFDCRLHTPSHNSLTHIRQRDRMFHKEPTGRSTETFYIGKDTLCCLESLEAIAVVEYCMVEYHNLTLLD